MHYTGLGISTLLTFQDGYTVIAITAAKSATLVG